VLADAVGCSAPSAVSSTLTSEPGEGSEVMMGTDAQDKAAASKSEGRKALEKLCPHVCVFARVAPHQKELIVAALNDAGHTTLMCGDGTNDVGALKQAHVGVSILNNPELEKRVAHRLEVTSATGVQAAGGAGWAKSKAKGASIKELAKAQLEAMQDDSNSTATAGTAGVFDTWALVDAEMSEQERDPSLVRLGDASIASPFTSKRVSVDCVLAVVRQGRCTLVTTVQVFKILALNCLVSAFMLSALYLHGVKQGDTQMTIVGLIVAALFFFASQAPPLEELAPKRPLSQLFCTSVLISVGGQFVVHLASLLYILELCADHMVADDPLMVPDGDFHPNILNSIVFILSAWMQLNTFAVNYCGKPFTQPLRDNKLLWYTLQGSWLALVLVSLDVVPPLRSVLQLVPLPTGSFRSRLLGVLFANLGGAWAVEQVARSVQ